MILLVDAAIYPSDQGCLTVTRESNCGANGTIHRFVAQTGSDPAAKCGIMSAVTAFDHLIAALEAAGLWRDIAEDQKRASIQALGSGEDVTWAAGGAWRADGEDLADGEVEAWLRRMAMPLNDCGLELRVATVSGPYDQGSAGYSVSVNEPCSASTPSAETSWEFRQRTTRGWTAPSSPPLR